MTSQQPAAEWVAIDTLTPWEQNPRRNDEAAKEVAKSIQRFGFGAPILARAADRVVIAGHTRLKAAALLGLDKVPVRFLDLDPAEARALALADNKLGELAEWDAAILGDVLRDLEADGAVLDGLGFSEEELRALMAEPAVEPSENDDDAPEVDEHGEPDSVPGGVYELGPHRLVCGDCTKPSLIAAMADGADAVIADPPYGTGIDAPTGLGNSKVPMRLAGDENPDLARHAVLAWSGIGSVQVWWGANYYSDACAGSPCWLVWDKDHHGMTFADAELAWVSAPSPVRVLRHAWSGMHRASERSVAREHPTQKPVALYVWAMDGRVPKNGIVVDPFGGSGTTLIACAQTGRIARLIELDPRYCDVIRRRWTRWAREHGRDPGPGALDG